MDEPTRRPPEPEIIPPGQPLPYRNSQVWRGQGAGSVHRIYVRQIGPLGATMLTLGVGVAAVAGFFFLITTAIIGLAVIGALTIAGVIMGILHGPPRPR